MARRGGVSWRPTVSQGTPVRAACYSLASHRETLETCSTPLGRIHRAIAHADQGFSKTYPRLTKTNWQRNAPGLSESKGTPVIRRTWRYRLPDIYNARQTSHSRSGRPSGGCSPYPQEESGDACYGHHPRQEEGRRCAGCHSTRRLRSRLPQHGPNRSSGLG